MSYHKRRHSIDRDDRSSIEWNRGRRSSSNGRARSRSYDPLKVGYRKGVHNLDDSDEFKPHDRALIRAMNSHIKPTKDHESDPDKTLFIGRLNSMTTEEMIRKHFQRYGDVRSLHLIRDILTGESRRYAFIEFRRSKDADRAYGEAHNSILDGRRILVDRELGRTMKDFKPRRLGGGFGGYKESGQMRFGGRSSGPSPSSSSYGSRFSSRPAPYSSRPPPRHGSGSGNGFYPYESSSRSSRSLHGATSSSSSYHRSSDGPMRSSRR